jgi:hypothetical protein
MGVTFHLIQPAIHDLIFSHFSPTARALSRGAPAFNVSNFAQSGARQGHSLMMREDDLFCPIGTNRGGL